MVTACSTCTNNTFKKSRTADIAVIDLKAHTDVISHLLQDGIWSCWCAEYFCSISLSSEKRGSDFLKEFSIEQISLLSGSDISDPHTWKPVKKKIKTTNLPYFKSHSRLKQLPGEHPCVSKTYIVLKCYVHILCYSMYKSIGALLRFQSPREVPRALSHVLSVGLELANWFVFSVFLKK